MLVSGEAWEEVDGAITKAMGREGPSMDGTGFLLTASTDALLLYNYLVLVPQY